MARAPIPLPEVGWGIPARAIRPWACCPVAPGGFANVAVRAGRTLGEADGAGGHPIMQIVKESGCCGAAIRRRRRVV
jgi:hypothetical protein